MTDVEDKKLPPYPTGIFDITPEEHYNFGYDTIQDRNDLNERRRKKLYNLWLFWVQIRTNTKILDIIEKNNEDKNSELFKLKELLVNIFDQYAKILTGTNLLEECFILDDKIKPNDN